MVSKDDVFINGYGVNRIVLKTCCSKCGEQFRKRDRILAYGERKRWYYHEDCAKLLRII